MLTPEQAEELREAIRLGSEGDAASQIYVENLLVDAKRAGEMLLAQHDELSRLRAKQEAWCDNADARAQEDADTIASLREEVERLRGALRTLRSEMFVCRGRANWSTSEVYDWVIGRIDAHLSPEDMPKTCPVCRNPWRASSDVTQLRAEVERLRLGIDKAMQFAQVREMANEQAGHVMAAVAYANMAERLSALAREDGEG